jgi:hypothetical protein
MQITCGTCSYFESAHAQCRRHPPVLLPGPEPELAPPRSQWPSVGPDDWCGDYEQAGMPALDQQRQDERAMGSEQG